MGIVSVEEVTRGKARVRFIELPQALHGDDARFAPPVRAWERYRLDEHRNPFFERGDARYFLARRQGRPAGRLTAHLAEPGGAGHFGFWASVDDPAVAAALVADARDWLTQQGCTSMVGPLSFEAADEPGLLVAGYEVPGTTGRPWHPPWEASLLEELGFVPETEQPTWRLPTTEIGPDPVVTSEPAPGQAGGYADRRLVLAGIAAVPDVADALRTSGIRAAWGLARRARLGDWDTCTVVRCTGDPALAVPALLVAAGSAGYRSVIAPWSPDPDAPPETVHRTYRLAW